MKIELKIVAEIEIDKEKYPDITPQMVFDGLRLYESDICDGFELTTSVKGCDNTADFFLKNAAIAGKKWLPVDVDKDK